MNKRSQSINSGKGVKTFFTYLVLVLFIVLSSVSIKAFFLYKESLFDGRYINIGVSQNKKLIGIIGFNGDRNEVIYLHIRNSKITSSDAFDKLGIITDAGIDSTSDISGENVNEVITNAAIKTNGTTTNLTLFDLARLWIISRNSTGAHIIEKDINLPIPDYGIDKNMRDQFMNDSVSSENVSIEIINAANIVSGGKKLERALTNEGFNIVSVSTKREPEKISRIEYSSSYSYALEKLKRILKYPSFKKDEKSIADVVIIIGEDEKRFGSN
jgi:hypothetical protein